VVAGVSLPEGQAPVALDILERLHPAERAAAQAHAGFRQVEWVGARLAWHAAAASLGLPLQPLLSGRDREPLSPPGLSVSLTHKRDLAIALVGPADAGALGVDLEGDGRERPRIAERVLREDELSLVAGHGPERRWLEVLVRFAVKEAIYKAVHPVLRRAIGFHEARVEVELGEVPLGQALADFTRVDALTWPRAVLSSEPRPSLECVAEHAGGRVLAAVRARW
jgi:4'-phosphopantetheinyl transferase EntD